MAAATRDPYELVQARRRSVAGGENTRRDDPIERSRLVVEGLAEGSFSEIAVDALLRCLAEHPGRDVEAVEPEPIAALEAQPEPIAALEAQPEPIAALEAEPVVLPDVAAGEEG